MRGAMFWAASTLLAFAATAGVFLALAELGTSPPEQSLDNRSERASEPNDPLSVEISQSALENLEEAGDQKLGVTVSNGSERELTDVTVYLILYSEDTSDQETRYYETPELDLAPLESKRASFDDLDLSPPDNGDQPQGSPGGSDTADRESFNILEVRAASSEGVSTVKTAVLSF